MGKCSFWESFCFCRHFCHAPQYDKRTAFFLTQTSFFRPAILSPHLLNLFEAVPPSQTARHMWPLSAASSMTSIVIPSCQMASEASVAASQNKPGRLCVFEVIWFHWLSRSRSRSTLACFFFFFKSSLYLACFSTLTTPSTYLK